MKIVETTAKSLLRKQKRTDSWFLSRFGMNLYRGCVHDCAYCDGRAEGYYVEGEFGKEVSVKINALELLDKELDPKRRRKPMARAFVILGGGVGDAYQHPESKYELARGALKIILKHGFPVHVLTKSALVERDMDILEEINREQKAVVSMSFSTVDDRIARHFEPGCALPSRRLEILRRFKDTGVYTGAFLMPVVPYVSDGPIQIDAAMESFRNVNVDFVLASGMTLKGGRQKTHFMKTLNDYKPGLDSEYSIIYGADDKYGSPDGRYSASLDYLLRRAARKHRLALRMPPRIYSDILDENDRVAVMLSHLDFFARENGERSPFRYAASSVAKLKEPIAELKGGPRSLDGVGFTTAKIIQEILDTGTCSRLEQHFRF